MEETTGRQLKCLSIFVENQLRESRSPQVLMLLLTYSVLNAILALSKPDPTPLVALERVP